MNTTASPQYKLDPDRVALRASPRPVKRLNRRTLIIAITAASAALAGGTLWSLRSGQSSTKNTAQDIHNVDHVAPAESLSQLPTDYSQLPKVNSETPVLGEPLPGDLGPAIVRAEQAGKLNPVDSSPYMRTRRTDGYGDQVHQEIAGASVFFKTSSPATTKAGNPVTSNTHAPSTHISPNEPFTVLSNADGGGTSVDPTWQQNQQPHKEAFLEKNRNTDKNASLQAPTSPYQVMAGTLIPAALFTGINSDLPGKIIATVTESIYDTATGHYLLIPQGSRLLGRYDSQIAFGQRRILMVWTRLILPDTSSIKLDQLPGVDTAGYAGLEDGVDWHWDRLLAGAALTTLLGVGAELAAPHNRNDQNHVIVAARDSTQDSINQVGQEMTRRNLSVQPTLTIRPGFTLRVMVNVDLILRPYQPLFFVRGAQ